MGLPRNYVGRCIYCDSTEGLTREHIIPEGIGGRVAPVGRHEAMVLRNASCRACREITMAFEGRILGKMMGHFRAATGMVRKDRRTSSRKVAVQDKNETVEVGIDQIAPMLLLPAFGLPGFIEGRPIGAPIQARLETTIINPNKIPRMDKALTLAELGPDIFGQLLAKIALGFAVQEIGINSFRPFVRELILGDVKQFGHWLGGEGLTRDTTVPPEPEALHNLTMGTGEHNGQKLVVVGVRLFANCGGPRNYVIVGEDLR